MTCSFPLIEKHHKLCVGIQAKQGNMEVMCNEVTITEINLVIWEHCIIITSITSSSLACHLQVIIQLS